MTRQFGADPLDDEVLDRLVYSGNRAPTAGNTPYRRLIILRDPRVLRLMRAVAPGYVEGDAAAMIVVFTDLSVADRNGNKIHSPWTSRLDAGAAAENIHLAATDMGLASSFFTSMSLEGVRELLDLPDHCRPEIVISVGHPGEGVSRARRTPQEAKTVFVDRYGKEWR